MTAEAPTRPFWWLTRASGVVLGLAAIFGAVVIAMLAWPYDQVTVDSPIRLIDRTVEAGEVVSVETDYCNPGYDVQTIVWLDSYAPSKFPETDTGPRVASELVDTLAAYGLDEFAGCYVTEVNIEIPPTRPPGLYKLRAESTWRLNPIRVDSLTTETEVFQVVERETDE